MPPTTLWDNHAKKDTALDILGAECDIFPVRLGWPDLTLTDENSKFSLRGLESILRDFAGVLVIRDQIQFTGP